MFLNINQDIQIPHHVQSYLPLCGIANGTASGRMQTFNFEDRLHDVIAERPELVATAAHPGPFALVGREVSVRVGRTDLLLGTTDGAISIIEAKLYRNPRFADVVSQVLAYRSCVLADPKRYAEHFYERFVQTARFMRGPMGFMSPLVYIGDRFGIKDEDGRAKVRATYQARMQTALASGTLRLVIVADCFPPDVLYQLEDARRRDPSLLIESIEIRRQDKMEVARVLNMRAADYEREFIDPDFARPEWERVAVFGRTRDAFRKQIHRDRFYGRAHHGGHRIDNIELPANFHFEDAPGRVTADSLLVHQVDPRRTESYAPSMPCARLLAETGNPYPPELTPLVITEPRFAEFVKISHAVWKRLKARGTIELTSDTDIIVEDIMKASKAVPGSAVEFEARGCVIDTLRDLALFGYATYERRGIYERRFALAGSDDR
jgi:hypothetical protein